MTAGRPEDVWKVLRAVTDARADHMQGLYNDLGGQAPESRPSVSYHVVPHACGEVRVGVGVAVSRPEGNGVLWSVGVRVGRDEFTVEARYVGGHVPAARDRAYQPPRRVVQLLAAKRRPARHGRAEQDASLRGRRLSGGTGSSTAGTR